MIHSLLSNLKENKSLLFFILLMLMFRSSFADWNSVPTGSMKPTIIEGDRILVNKMAYDIYLPFTHLSLLKIADPVTGDIIVFNSQVSDKKLVKRVIGVPGDMVAMEDNTLFINGRPLSYTDLESTAFSTDKIEDLAGVKHAIRIRHGGSELSSFSPIVVPPKHFLTLGDNRDNSADSRVIGFVPRHEIVGRTRSVVMSLNYGNYFIPRWDRFFHTL